jgi:uncharacterized membrane protein
MSSGNPYTQPANQSYTGTVSDESIRKVEIRPFELLSRGKQLLGEQYWIFVVMGFLTVFLGSIVPFGILMGPLLVGFHMCLRDRELGRAVEIGDLFRGFDKFVDALVAFLILMVISFVVAIPGIIVLFALVAIAANIDPSGALTVIVALIGGLMLFILCMMAYLPGFFAYQLIADRGVPGLDAVRLSVRGCMKNLGGVVVYMLLMSLISFAASLLCYIPAFLVLPIIFSSMFVLYRDIYGPSSTGFVDNNQL